MILNSNSMKPIYVQIAEYLEGEILRDSIRPDEKIYSQYQLAEMFNINPATAAKGLNLLADEDILYKRRGLGMFVAADAKKIILTKRTNTKLKELIEETVREARQLGISKEELIEMIQKEGEE
ncbi:GntR family transcriptional regulator [Robertmurraya sp. FSL R5-0851]|uniref:GntR family transcriptional regulator n=1 Tax=Robertmurraya sp. FSL R5-0851 TaxID=2921584 RepID=UPI0030FCF383